MARRIRTIVGHQLVAFARDPLNVALAVIIPLALIQGFGKAMTTFPYTPSMEIAPAVDGKITGALFSTGFMAGLFGLHQSLSAEQADRRLVQAGLSPSLLLVTRIFTVLVVCAGVAGLSYAILARSLDPAAPVLAYLSLLLASGVYVFVGMLVGTASPGLFEGSLVVLIIADMDAFLGSGMASIETSLKFLPLYYPNELFRAALFDGTIPQSLFVPQLGYLLVLAVVTGVLYQRSMGAGGAF